MFPRSASKARRSRVCLLWGLMLFIGGQVVLNGLAASWRPFVHYPEFGYPRTALRQRLAEEPGRPLLLALGSSRTGLGFRPDALPTYHTPDGAVPVVHNFGVPGAGVLEELLYLDRFLAEGIRPDWVVLEVLPVALQARGDNVTELDVDHLAGRDLKVLLPLCSRPWQLLRRWCQQRLLPGFADRLELMTHYAPSWMPPRAAEGAIPYRDVPDRFGWWHCPPDPRPEVRERLLQHAHDQYYARLQDFWIGDGADRALRQLLTRCRQERIAVVLHIMPEGTTFHTWYAPATRDTLDRYLAAVSQEFHVPVIDARDWFGDEDFSDSHHLLPASAARFTQRFGREVLQPLIEGRRMEGLGLAAN